MLIQDAFEQFLKESLISRKSQATLTNYRQSVNSFLNYIKGSIPQQDIDLLTTLTLDSYFLHGIQVNLWSKYTQWTYYKNLSAFFNWCERKQLISKNPLKLIPKPRLPHPYPKSLSEQEVREIIQKLDTIPWKYEYTRVRNKAIIMMLLYTGIRKSELMNLNYSDVDIQSGFIYVRNGKGDKSREIPIQEDALSPVIRKYLTYRSEFYAQEGAFFTSVPTATEGIKPLPERAFRAIFVVINKRLGTRIHAHQLRHTFATLLLEKTGDIYVLKELLGHSRISTTEIYLSTTRNKKVEDISHL